jgi:hypothetical protein
VLYADAVVKDAMDFERKVSEKLVTGEVVTVAAVGADADFAEQLPSWPLAFGLQLELMLAESFASD